MKWGVSCDQQGVRYIAGVLNREYKPDVQLRYMNKFSKMNQKEAFKQLSH